MAAPAYANGLWLVVLLLLQHIYNAAAIKCYVCDSSVNPSCENLSSNSSIVAEECKLEKRRSINSWLFELNKYSYFETGPNRQPLMTCQKVVAQNPIDKKWVTARFCQLDMGSTDACVNLRSQFKKQGLLDDAQEQIRNSIAGDNKKSSADKDQKEFFCSVCNEDFCNGSTFLTVNAAVSVLLLLITIIMQH